LFITNRFSVVRPIRPYAGLRVTPCGSKIMADCYFTHRTSKLQITDLTLLSEAQ